MATSCCLPRCCPALPHPVMFRPALFYVAPEVPTPPYSCQIALVLCCVMPNGPCASLGAPFLHTHTLECKHTTGRVHRTCSHHTLAGPAYVCTDQAVSLQIRSHHCSVCVHTQEMQSYMSFSS